MSVPMRASWSQLLEHVPWASMKHAYGSAEDVPELVRALATDGHDEALHALFGNVWHQGTVYEATEHVVPALVALVTSGDARNIPDVLGLLAAIAAGTGYLAVHGRGDEAARDREARWVGAAHAAVARCENELAALVRDGEARVRVAAAHVLGCIQPSSASAARAIVEALERETVSLTRSGMMLSLGHTGSVSSFAIPRLAHCFADERAPTEEQLAAAIAIARIAGPATRVEHVARLAEACARPEEWESGFEGLPWDWSGDERPGEVLLACGAAAIGAIPILCDALRILPSFDASALLDDVLAIAFPSPVVGSLDAIQRVAAHAIVESAHLWDSPPQIVVPMKEAGLWPEHIDPSRASEARTFIAELLVG